jgi:putative spermidine/putrescine transport system ATP-binding protein
MSPKTLLEQFAKQLRRGYPGSEPRASLANRDRRHAVLSTGNDLIGTGTMNDPEGTIALRFTSVNHFYGANHAVADLDLTIRQGEFFALLGPSGSGKTTLLMLIAGFETPTNGVLEINGRPANNIPVHRRDIGVVFQNYALFPHMSVSENIAYPLRERRVPRREREERVAAALDLVKLADKANAKPLELSGGQQQRVALARAVVFGPSVLLMDEPLGALDRALREDMQFELKRIHNELGVTVVYVTHDQGEAMAMADRIGVMHEGRLQQVAPPQELFGAPGNGFIARFVGESALVNASRVENAWMIAGTKVAITDAPPHASDVTIALRPDLVSAEFVDCQVPGRVHLPAVVDAITYLGTGWRIRATLRSGQPIIATATRSSFDDRITSGAEIFVCWQSGEEVTLPNQSHEH